MKEPKNVKKRFPVLPAVLGCALVAAAAAYGGGLFYYQSHFLPGTVVDRIDVSGMTMEEVKDQVQDYSLCIEERKEDGSILEEEIQGKDIALSYSSEEPLQKLLEEQDTRTWFLPQSAEYTTEGLIACNEEKLEEQVRKLQGFQKDFAKAPTDAYIADYTPEEGFQIVPETQGNLLDESKTLETIKGAVLALEERVNLEEAGCYETPQVTSEDEDLRKVQEKLQKYADIQITYTFGENQEVLNGQTISEWIHVDGTDVTLDQAHVEAFVASLRKKYDSIFRPRTFQTSYGKEVTIKEGDYGWWMNADQEVQELMEMIERGESGARTPVYYQTADRYGTPDYGDTYVEINLTAQHLFFYKDGNLLLESDFVSGNSSRGYDTPAGVYGVTYTQRNATLTGENYRTPVSYWMPFNRNIGMHDASWRGSFGSNIYKTNGSHGCINLPPSTAREIYENIEKGTPVICYHLPGTEPVVREKGAPPAEEGQGEAPAENPEIPPAEEPVPEPVPEVPVEEPVPEPVPEVPVETPVEAPPAEG